jgi:hypothetical protein
MPHTTRITYKDKMTTQGQALRLANTAVQALTHELQEREEREEELFYAIMGLAPAMTRLSGTLQGTQGDFGVGLETLDQQVDKDIRDCRPAIIINRVVVLLDHANARLEQLHIEHEETADNTNDLVASLQLLHVASESSIRRRNKLLILGGSFSDDTNTRVNDSKEPYKANPTGLTIDDVYETKSVTLDEADQEEIKNAPNHSRAMISGKKKLGQRRKRLVS